MLPKPIQSIKFIELTKSPFFRIIIKKAEISPMPIKLIIDKLITNIKSAKFPKLFICKSKKTTPNISIRKNLNNAKTVG